MSGDRGFQFVDTNILVYAYDSEAGLKHERARRLLAALWREERGCVSIQVLQEFYVVVTRKIPRPLPSHVASQIIADLGLWRVHQPHVADILNAVDLQHRYALSFWDAMILQSALVLDCSVLWSEDLSHLQIYHQIQVRNPFADG